MFRRSVCTSSTVIHGLSKRCNQQVQSSSCETTSADTTPSSTTLLAENSELKNELVETFLNLETLDLNLFRSHHLLGGSNASAVVYGGQVIGQALVAASNTVDSAYHPHSLHSYFTKHGKVAKPILYSVDRVRDGKSFCTRFVKAVQDGVPIFTSEMSFHREEADSISHQAPMPQTLTPPEELEDARAIIERLLLRDGLSVERRRFLEMYRANLPDTFDIRPVDPTGFVCDEPRPPAMQLWVRSKAPIGADVRLHHCVAAYISDSSMVGTALMPHAGTGFRVGMLTTLDHSIWFNRYRLRIDDWMLYDTDSPVAAAGRALIFGKLWSRDGTLALTTAQEALIRAKL